MPLNLIIPIEGNPTTGPSGEIKGADHDTNSISRAPARRLDLDVATATRSSQVRGLIGSERAGTAEICLGRQRLQLDRIEVSPGRQVASTGPGRRQVAQSATCKCVFTPTTRTHDLLGPDRARHTTCRTRPPTRRDLARRASPNDAKPGTVTLSRRATQHDRERTSRWRSGTHRPREPQAQSQPERQTPNASGQRQLLTHCGCPPCCLRRPLRE